MQCPQCQQDNPIHARLCLGCGALLALVCGACGADLPQEARFCLQCRHALAGRPASPAIRAAPNRSYVRAVRRYAPMEHCHPKEARR